MIGPYPPRAVQVCKCLEDKKDRLATKMLHEHPTWRPFVLRPPPNCLLPVVDSKRRAVGIVRLRHPKKASLSSELLIHFLFQSKHMNTLQASATTTFIAAFEFFFQIIVVASKKTKGMSLESLENRQKKSAKVLARLLLIWIRICRTENFLIASSEVKRSVKNPTTSETRARDSW